MNRAEPAILRRIQFYGFAGFVFFSTLSIAISQLCFGLALAAWLGRVVILRRLPASIVPERIYMWTGLYVVWMIIASIAGETPVRSLLIMKEEWLFTIIPVGLSVMSDDKDRKRIVRLLAVSVIVMSLYGIIQSQTGWHILKPGEARIDVESGVRISGNFSHPLTYANYFGLVGAFLFGFLISTWNRQTIPYRTLFLSATVLAAVASLLTQSRITVLALLFTLVVAALIMGRRYFLPLAAGLVVVLSAVTFMGGLQERLAGAWEREFSDNYRASRLYVWSRAITIIKEHPVFGVGQGNFTEEYGKLLPPDTDTSRRFAHAHNDLLNTAAICGLPGMLFFLGIFAAVSASLIREWKGTDLNNESRPYIAAALLALGFYAVAWLTEATFADEEVRQLLMFIWAIGLAPMYKVSSAPVKTMVDLGRY